MVYKVALSAESESSSASRRVQDARARSLVLASAAAIGIQFGTAQGLSLVLEWNLYLAQCCGILLGTVVNYLANNRWTFASKDGTSS